MAKEKSESVSASAKKPEDKPKDKADDENIFLPNLIAPF